MTVYVDWIQPCAPTEKWPYKKSCHLFADTVAELHYFAKQIGLKRWWFQEKPGFPHYDLTEGKRVQAVRAGAKAIEEQRDWLKLIQSLRPTWYQEGY